MAEIILYPRLTRQGDLDSLLSRLAWYFKPYLPQIDHIRISCAGTDMLQKVGLAPHLDPAIAADLPLITEKLHYHSEAGLIATIRQANPETDILLIWDVSAEAEAPAAVKAQIKAMSKHSGVYRVDPVGTRQEGSFFLWCGLNKFNDAKALARENEQNFQAMTAELGHYGKAYVFGTGPSFSDFVGTHDFGDGLCIAANSIVKNTEALERLNPRIICAADPIYHAGCSSYASSFRDELKKALDKTGAWFVCPLRDLAIYRMFLPPRMHDRLIGIPFDKTRPIPVRLDEAFYVNPFPNVLTLLLLPLAATFADSIHVVGCDGRKLLDDSFFWSHDKKVQFNDQLAEIKAAHPGFFNIDYNDYYTEHCTDLEHVLSALEAAGRTVVTETPSFIPALRHRQRDTETFEPVRAPSALVMLDPDAKDDWGHFLAYDKRIAAAARDLGLGFALICRKELAPEFAPEGTGAFLPSFSIHSWTVGNKKPPRSEDLMHFARELDEGLTQAEAAFPRGELLVFFYVGSIEVAELLEHLLIGHRRVRAVINLFWSYNFDQNDPAYRKRWQAVLRRLHQHPRLHLMHATHQIAEEFERDWGIALPVLEHPSTTFSDAAAQVLAQQPIDLAGRDASQPFRVVFPGGARAEKGFALSVAAADMLRGDSTVAPALRTRLDKVSGPALHRVYEALDKTGIEIIDQDLSDDAFIEMIATADIIVIPYHAEAFRRRTSGILVDAMLLGKPVVVLENTWLADFVRQREIGVAVPETAEAIEQGLATVMADHARFAGKAAEARRHYLENNSWAAMVRHIGRLAGFALPALSAVRTRRDLLASLALSDRPEDLTALLGLGAAGLILDQPETRSLLADCALFRLALERAATRSSALSAPGGGHSALGRVIGDSFLQEMIVTGDP